MQTAFSIREYAALSQAYYLLKYDDSVYLRERKRKFPLISATLALCSIFKYTKKVRFFMNILKKLIPITMEVVDTCFAMK